MHRFDERARWLARNVLPHEPALRAWLARRPVAGLDIDDIVQETYSRLSLTASVEDIRNPRTYLITTARSVMLSHIRHARVVPMHSMTQLEAMDFVADEPDPETIAADRDELRRLAEAIGQLPPRTREVLVLRRVKGMSQREVAQKLGVAESTIEKQMSKGFSRLAEILGRGGKADAGASRDMTEGNVAAHAKRDKPGD
jgi:RNA polymerase sigma-70 factor (ECF subfamily)